MALDRVPLAVPSHRGIKLMGTSRIDNPAQYDLIRPSGLAKELFDSNLMDWIHRVG